LLPLFVLWLLCLGSYLQAGTERRRVAFGAATAVCAAWLWAAHGRMIVAVGVTGGAFLVLVIRRGTALRSALIGLAIVAVGLGAGRRFGTAMVLIAMATTTAAVALLRAGVQPPGLANRWNVASLPSPTFQLGPKVLLAAGVAAMVAFVAVAVAQRRNPAVIAPL